MTQISQMSLFQIVVGDIKLYHFHHLCHLCHPRQSVIQIQKRRLTTKLLNLRNLRSYAEIPN